MIVEVDSRIKNAAALVFGGSLIILGVLFLVGQFLDIPLGNYLWPLLVLVPGVLLFALALNLSGPEEEGMFIAASVVTMLGLVLLVQNLTGLWATWAYAWALVAPTAAGLGMLAYGRLKGRSRWTREGSKVVKIGLGLFIAGAIFFEAILNISGLGLNRWGLPLALILLGGFVLWREIRYRM